MKYVYELMLENYARCTCLFQSPRSGKFVSNVCCYKTNAPSQKVSIP